MLRALMLFAAFAIISPVFRGYVTGAYGAFDHVVSQNATIAYAATGMLVFASVLAIKLTARK